MRPPPAAASTIRARCTRRCSTVGLRTKCSKTCRCRALSSISGAMRIGSTYSLSSYEGAVVGRKKATRRGILAPNIHKWSQSSQAALGGLTSLTRLYLAFNPIPPDHTLHFPGGWHPDLQIYSGVLSVPNLFPRLSSSLNRFVFSYKEALAKGRVSSRVVPSACDWEFVDRDFLLWDSSRPAPSIPVSLQTDTSEDVDTVASYLKDQGHAPERLRTWKGGSEDAIKGQLSACVPISLLVSLSERPGVLMVRLGYRAMELPSTGVGRKSWGNLKSRPQ